MLEIIVKLGRCAKGPAKPINLEKDAKLRVNEWIILLAEIKNPAFSQVFDHNLLVKLNILPCFVPSMEQINHIGTLGLLLLGLVLPF